MSPSIDHRVPLHVLIASRAVWQPFWGLNPCELSLHCGSSYASTSILITSSHNLSFHPGIPNGRVLFLFRFTMYVLLTGFQTYCFFLSVSIMIVILARDIPSTVSLESIPGVIAPLLAERFAYAARENSSQDNIRYTRLSSAFFAPRVPTTTSVQKFVLP